MLSMSVQRGALLRGPVALETVCSILPLSKGKSPPPILAVGNYSMGEQNFLGVSLPEGITSALAAPRPAGDQKFLLPPWNSYHRLKHSSAEIQPKG